MRLPQQRQCGDIVMLAHQQQAERMSDIGIVRLDLQCAAQQFGTLLIHPPHPIEIGQIRQRRHEPGIDPQCRAIFRLSLIAYRGRFSVTLKMVQPLDTYQSGDFAGAGVFERAPAVPSVRLLPLVVLYHVLDLRLHCLAFVLGIHRATTPHTTSSVSLYRDRLFRELCRLGNTL